MSLMQFCNVRLNKLVIFVVLVLLLVPLITHYYLGRVSADNYLVFVCTFLFEEMRAGFFTTGDNRI